MDIIWLIKNKIFAFAEKKTIAKFVTQQFKMRILEYLREEEDLTLWQMDFLKHLLQATLHIFVIKVCSDIESHTHSYSQMSGVCNKVT